MNIKKLPSSVSSEKAILGCLLIDKQVIKFIKDLKPNEFYDPTCALVYKTIQILSNDGKDIDLITVNNEIKRQGKDLVEFLAECTTDVFTSNYQSYIDIIKATNSKRYLIKLGESICGDAFREETSPKKIIENLKTSILEISNKTSKVKPKNGQELKSVMHKELERKIELQKSGKDLILRSNGLSFERGSHTVIGALPSHGKSMLLMDLLLDFAKQGYKVLYVNIEMTEKQVLDRIYSYLTGIDSTIFKYLDAPNILDLIKQGEKEFDKIKENFHMVTKGSISSGEVSAIVGDMILNNGVDVHGVDYLGILKEEGKSKTEQMSKASNTIRSIAKDFNTISITAAQFSKEGYKQKPSFAFIKDSSTIYDDADMAMVLYRKTDNAKFGEPTHEINIEKNRTGNLGLFDYSLNPKISKFTKL